MVNIKTQCKYKIMAVYPPSDSNYQRGEERCQINVESSCVNSLRGCNDLGYVASILNKSGFNVSICDYQAEKKNLNVFLTDMQREKPDIVFISTTNASINTDIDVITKLKALNPNTIVILKGALFFNCNEYLFKNLNLSNIDYLIGGEVEFIISDLVNAHFYNKNLLEKIEGISYKKNGQWITNKINSFHSDIDALPFPDRYKMKNNLYINPETNKPMALITTAKGCCYQCKYCLSPIISGKKIRERSTQNIFDEIEECINEHNITNFFFKSDTFTVNKTKVIDLCEKLIEKKYNEKINWVATARVDTIDDELLSTMKKAGCSLLAIGFESGSNESLQKMAKNTTIEQNLKAAKLCKKYGIKILGYFLIGFPWEDISHLEETKKHIFAIDADYIEISVVVPFLGTPIYEEYVHTSKSDCSVLGTDSYRNIFKDYSKLDSKKLKTFRKNILLKFYMRPSYIYKKLKNITSFGILCNYLKYGVRLMINTIQ